MSELSRSLIKENSKGKCSSRAKIDLGTIIFPAGGHLFGAEEELGQ